MPSQQAINGALDLYVAGSKTEDIKQMLFGLSVLRHATEEQVQAAMGFVETSQKTTHAAIVAALAS